MLAPLMFATAAMAAEGVVGGGAGMLVTKRDWRVGCDNLLSCRAMGFPAGSDVPGAFVAVDRGPGAEARPSVSIFALPGTRTAASSDRALRLAVTGGAHAGAGLELSGKAAEPYVTATLDGAAARALIAALIAGHALEVELGGVVSSVSLFGATAALRLMDETQGRTGTTSALVQTGAADVLHVPAPPTVPSVAALPIAPLDPPPALPPALATKATPDCAAAPIAFRLDDQTLLWGICGAVGASNTGFVFWIDGPEGPRMADFTPPGRAPGADPGMLFNPALEGRVLRGLYLGRGLGDCGSLGNWVWTPQGRFQPVYYAEMAPCQGAVSGQWPVLFLANAIPG